jgi:hypothetical protein
MSSIGGRGILQEEEDGSSNSSSSSISSDSDSSSSGGTVSSSSSSSSSSDDDHDHDVGACSSDEENSYLQMRKEKIARNNAFLASLGLSSSNGKHDKKKKKQPTKRSKVPCLPVKRMPSRLVKSKVPCLPVKRMPSRLVKSKGSSKVNDSDGDSTDEEFDSETDDEFEPETIVLQVVSPERVVDPNPFPNEMDSPKTRLDLKKKQRKCRRKPSETLNNACMAKNERGKVEISKLAFKPEKILKDADFSGLMGVDGMWLAREKREVVKAWFERLKEVTGHYCRERVRNEVIKNSTSFGFGWVVIQDIQDAWARALDHETRVVVGKKIMRCLSEGYFSDRNVSWKVSWKYALEREVLEKYDLAYLPEEDGN